MKKGFTLVELVVVIALIAILAVTLAPRLRDQLAKAKDTKGIAILGSLRTQSEVYYAEKGKTPVENETDGGKVGNAAHEKAALEALIGSLDNSAQKMFSEASGTTNVPVGGSRTAAAADDPTSKFSDPVYGGEIGFTFSNPSSYVSDDDNEGEGDGIGIWFTPTIIAGVTGEGNTLDTIGKEWASY